MKYKSNIYFYPLSQKNSLSRSISSSDPVSEILSAFGPATEYLSVTNDNYTDRGSNQGNGNLDDGSLGDQQLNELHLTEERANSLKRKIGSFKVVNKVDHVVGNDVVKEATVVMPTVSYQQDTPSIKNTDEGGQTTCDFLVNFCQDFFDSDMRDNTWNSGLYRSN